MAIFIEHVDNIIGGNLDVAFFIAIAIYEDGSVNKVHIFIFEIA